MKSRTTTQFRKMFADLPEQVQEQTRKAYRQFKQDASCPSLRFKNLPGLNITNRAVLGQLDEDTVTHNAHTILK